MKKIEINTEFITLSQLMKITSICSSGGHAKFFIVENDIFYNGVLEKRRGKKLYKDDIIKVVGYDEFMIIKND